jgi:hypothetical protein
MINKYFLAFFLATALVGCGGSGEDLSSSMDGSGDGSSGGSGGTTNQSAEGLWVGQITSQKEGAPISSIGIIRPTTGEYFFATNSDYSTLINGTGFIEGSKITSKDFVNPDSKLGAKSGTFEGSVVTSKTLLINEFSLGSNKVSGTFSFASLYNTGSNLNKLTGEYGSTVDSQIKYSFEFKNPSADKTNFIGTSSNLNCQYLGTLSLIDATKNIYRLTDLTIEKYDTRDNIQCNQSSTVNSALSGYAAFVEVGGKTSLLLLAINDVKNTTFSAVLNKK